MLVHRSFGLTMVKSESLLWVEPSSGLEEPEVVPAIRGSWKVPGAPSGSIRTKPRPRLIGGVRSAAARPPAAPPSAACRSPSWDTRM